MDMIEFITGFFTMVIKLLQFVLIIFCIYWILSEIKVKRAEYREITKPPEKVHPCDTCDNIERIWYVHTTKWYKTKSGRTFNDPPEYCSNYVPIKKDN